MNKQAGEFVLLLLGAALLWLAGWALGGGYYAPCGAACPFAGAPATADAYGRGGDPLGLPAPEGGFDHGPGGGDSYSLPSPHAGGGYGR